MAVWNCVELHFGLSVGKNFVRLAASLKCSPVGSSGLFIIAHVCHMSSTNHNMQTQVRVTVCVCIHDVSQRICSILLLRVGLLCKACVPCMWRLGGTRQGCIHWTRECLTAADISWPWGVKLWASLHLHSDPSLPDQGWVLPSLRGSIQQWSC